MSDSGAAKHIDRGVLWAGVGLVSFSALLLELALTRLFSVVLYYHFAFLAISLAMLGLGAGGVFCFLRRDWLARWELRGLASLISILNVAAILLALLVALHVRVFLMLEATNVLRLSALYLAAGLPFFFSGLLLALVLARESRSIAPLYGADLIGGALACLVIVPMLNRLGAPNTILCAALGMAVAAAVWADTGTRRGMAGGVMALLIATMAMNHSQTAIDVAYAKGKRVAAADMSQWNALSRIEVNQWNNDKWVLIDQDAATMIAHTDPKDPKASSRMTVVNLLRPRGDYAIIGPGGGVDVLAAVIGGSHKVVGNEINPTIANTIMRDRYAEYSHGLYSLPQVRIHVDEGRAWIRSSQDQFDVIQMSLVDT